MRQDTSGGAAAMTPPPTNRLRLHRQKRRRRIARVALRLSAVVCGGAVAAYLAFAFMVKVVHPYKLGYEVGRDADRVRADLRAQRAENARLEERLRYLRSDEGVEREARSAGFYRPGETVYLLREP
jgi:cell division protein FtsB